VSSILNLNTNTTLREKESKNAECMLRHVRKYAIRLLEIAAAKQVLVILRKSPKKIGDLVGNAYRVRKTYY
jgi:hypothetical protein